MGEHTTTRKLYLESETSPQINVSLAIDNPAQADTGLVGSSTEDSLLPAPRFTPRLLLGAGNSQHEILGQLYASHIGSLITTKNPEESRPLVLGLGLSKEAALDTDRETFLKMMDMVLEVI